MDNQNNLSKILTDIGNIVKVFINTVINSKVFQDGLENFILNCEAIEYINENIYLLKNYSWFIPYLILLSCIE